jgi:predicted nucleic acid-binding protein
MGGFAVKHLGTLRDSSEIELRDPDDERILAEALDAGVQILVSGDKDFLSVAESAPIPILSPRAFMMLARGGAL